MNVEIKTYFYGERGLIDSLLLDLYALPEDKQIILLNKIFKKEYKKSICITFVPYARSGDCSVFHRGIPIPQQYI